MSPSSLPRGITRTPTGYRASIRVNGELYQERFKPDTPLEQILAWRRHTRADVERRRGPVAPPGTFAADAVAYLAAVRAMPTYDERKRHIGLWVERFGTLPRDAITPVMIRTVRDEWLTVGPKMVQAWKRNPVTGRKDRRWEPVTTPLSASAVTKRMRALENLFTILGGRRGYNPVREVPEPAEPERAARALPLAVIRQVLAAMPESLCKRWLTVLAYTGIPPMTIARMSTAMVDLEAGIALVPGRKKGKGTKGRRLPLTPDGREAWRLFIREASWREQPPKGNMKRAWSAACRAVERASATAGVPIDLSGTTPYALRHSVGTLAHLATGDIQATSQVLGVSLATALRYAQGALDPRLELAVQRLAEAQAGGAKVP